MRALASLSPILQMTSAALSEVNPEAEHRFPHSGAFHHTPARRRRWCHQFAAVSHFLVPRIYVIGIDARFPERKLVSLLAKYIFTLFVCANFSGQRLCIIQNFNEFSLK